MNKIREEIVECLEMAEHGIVMKRVDYLLSIIEQAESKCKEIETATKYLQHVPIIGLVHDLAEEALQAIRKGD